jgi:predicted RNA-binding Zn-ribbon protein involved in translation (DUF1610 family)
MTDYQFACPDCGQGIEINAPMREAILSNGCPVCSAVVADSDFECA